MQPTIVTWVLVVFGVITLVPLFLAQFSMLIRPDTRRTTDLIVGKGEDWRDSVLHLPLRSWLNGQRFGAPEAGVDMQFNFAQLIDTVNNKKAPMFSFAWSSDYPDAENNLALFYTPNVSPGSNHFNYSNKTFDELYEKILVMSPSAERTKIMEEMRDMVVTDVPFIGSMARTRFYLVQPWLKNYRPEEVFYNWIKYMDLDETQRP